METVTLRRTLLYCVVPVLTLAAAYALVGRLGLLLAIPPGYATVLWPSSGLALTSLLIGGARVWPGIWLGSFIVNIGIAFNAADLTALLTSVAIPATIGLGAVLQALVGASLVHRYVGFPNSLTRAKEIGALLALGGPVSCLISATVGVTTLAISGQIPWAMYFINWGTWWVGDTFGVLITAPLVLSWLADPGAIRHYRRRSAALPLMVFGALALVVAVFGYTRAQEQERLRLLFAHQAEALAHTIQNRLNDYLGALQTLKGFYTSIPEMGGEACHIFTLQSLAPRPGLQALAWDLRALGMQPEKSSTLPATPPNAPRNLLQPPPSSEESGLAYGEPHLGNKRALGFDVTSIPGYPEALHQARDTGLPAVSGRVMLGETPGGQFGQLVFLPVYGPGLLHPTVADRRQHLCGYVTGVFRIGDIVAASWQGLEQNDLILRIEDELAPADQHLMYDSRGPATEWVELLSDSAIREQPEAMYWQTTVALAGRPLELHFAPTPEYLAVRQSLQPWVALVGGLAFTSILGAFLLIITGRAIIIEQLMVERTTQLETSQKLEAAAKQRRREAEVLAELAQTINALDVGTVLQRVTDGAMELCGSDGAAIALREVGVEAAVIRYWSGMPSRGYHGGRIELDHGIGGLVVTTGHPFRTEYSTPAPGLSEDPLPTISEGREASVLVVPIRIGDQVNGLLYVGTRHPRTFTDLDETILQRLADHAAIALHNAQLYTAAEHRRHTAESLAEVGRLLSQSLDSLEVGQQVADHVQELLQAQVAALYQLDPSSGMLVVLAGSHNFRPAAHPWFPLPPGTGAIGLAVDRRQPVVTSDILNDSRITFSATMRAGIELTSVRAVLALPILRDGKVIGALSIGDELGRVFDQEDIELARLFADQASSALANAQLYAEVQAAHERLQGLSRQLLEVQEAERRRIAHELHDQAGQLLVSVHLALEAALTRLPPQFRECFHSVRGHLDAIEAQLRRLSHELRPTILDDLGLLPALQFLAQGVMARTGLCICVESTLEGRLAPHIETALYRIMQEGITNITKHAAATHVQLQLLRDAGTVRGLLQDDGVGFAVDQMMHPEGPRGLGLLGIQERLGALGGTLQITSAPGQGTILQIMVPVEPREASADADETKADTSFRAPARHGRTRVGDAA